MISITIRFGADLIGPALAGDQRAFERLFSGLEPVIRASVRRKLRDWHPAKTLGPYDNDDLAQEIWLILLKDDGKRLRAYDPNRGASLKSYVGIVAKTETGQLLRRQQAHKRGGGVQHHDLDEARGLTGGTDPEAWMIGRDLAERVRQQLLASLAPKGQLVYAHVYEDALSPAEAARLMNVTTQVVYNWQHKIRSIVRGLLPTE